MTRTTRMLTIIALFTTAQAGIFASSGSAQAHEHHQLREIEIIVEGAFKPQRIEIQEGERVRLRFVRKDYGPCTREVVFPKLNLRRELPTGQPTLVELSALTAGEYELKCGMNMIKGVLVVTAKRG